MKSLAILTLALVFSAAIQAQTDDKFTQAMGKMLEKFNEADSPEQWQAAANAFERIGNAESDQWLPWYYAGYANVMLAFQQKGLAMIDPILDKADKQIARAEAISAENAEIFVLKSMAASARIRVDFNRGMQYGPAASGYATRATIIQDGNPRGWLQLGQNLLFTPEQFGGGPTKGCPLLQKAQDRFETFQPAYEIDPNWGKEYLEEVMKQSCSGLSK